MSFNWRGWMGCNDTEFDVSVTLRDFLVQVTYLDNSAENECPYDSTLVLDDWSRRPELVRKTVDLFMLYRRPQFRNAGIVGELFCTLSLDDSNPVPLGSDGEQKVYVLVQVVRDVLDYINRVFELYPGRIQEYALFARSSVFPRPPDMNPYGNLVHEIACRTIRDHALCDRAHRATFHKIPCVCASHEDDQKEKSIRKDPSQNWVWVKRIRKGVRMVDGQGNPITYDPDVASFYEENVPEEVPSRVFNSTRCRRMSNE